VGARRHLRRREPSRQSRQLVFIIVTLGLAATFTAAGGWTGLAGRGTLEGGDRGGGETAMKVVPSVPDWDPNRDPADDTRLTPIPPGSTGTTAAQPAGAVIEAAGATGATTLSSVSLLPGASPPAAVNAWRPRVLGSGADGVQVTTTATTLPAPATTAAAAPSAAPTTTTVVQAPDTVPTTTTPETTTTTTGAPAAAVVDTTAPPG
jgi:hypothetical protein